MKMRLHIILISIILLQCNCEEKSLVCPERVTSSDDYICIERSDCNPQRPDVTWKDLDYASGKVTFVLSNFNLCKDEYFLMLQAIELETETECNETQFEKYKNRYGEIEHSRRKVLVKRANDKLENYPYCEKVLNVTFNFIYKGCYRFRLRPLHSDPIFFNTSLTKKSIFKEHIFVKTHYDQEQNHMSHTISGLNKLHVSKLEVRIRKCPPGRECDDCNESMDTQIITSDYAANYSCVDGNNTTMNCTSVGGTYIKCITPNIKDRSQCALVQILNHPCRGLGVWKNSNIHINNGTCLWNSKIENVRILRDKSSKLQDDQSPVIIMSCVFSVLILTCLCVLLFIWARKRWKWISLPEHQPLSQPVLSPIILLYSRDCEPFMDLMATFKTTLEEILKCKVHDCFDPAVAEEVGCGKIEWLYRQTCTDTKIVIVESKCATFHQAALLHGKKLHYRNPTWLDDIFLNGLQKVTRDMWKNQYDKVFVVCVDGFTDENDNLRIITPSTRYTIPQHLGDLLYNLCGKMNLQEKEFLQALERDIKNLEEYKKNNINYLDQLLERTQI